MVIWITGASSGLGQELARQYAQEGHEVCISARSADALEAFCREWPQGNVHAWPLDITDREGLQAVYGQLTETHGIPELVVLNAGTHKPDSIQNMDPEIFDRVIQINLTGTVNCLAAVMPSFLARRSGHIAVVSSVAGYRGLPYAMAYGASKAALINMCESMQPELAAAGVTLSLVNPGFVRTPLTDKNEFDMPFLMELDDAGRALKKGLESGRFEITFPKRFTWILKGMRIMPISLYLWLTRRLVK
ncbi:MAG: SDR family NAD(P)-dependent oxidoreductase [Gammaproteobacteria bacterium]|nr:SDR family NAD(P)-dependent oxidoreductase [Gammaproteobacteria bacterium]